MKPCLCGLLVLLSFFSSLLDSLINSLMVLQLIFCTSVEIPNFFCDVLQLLHLACSDTSIEKIIIYFTGTIFGGIPTQGSFTPILELFPPSADWNWVPSADGKYKIFSTCGSHLVVICLFYGTALGAYLSSAISQSLRKDAVASVMYTCAFEARIWLSLFHFLNV